jgi:WD40 repeat protein
MKDSNCVESALSPDGTRLATLWRSHENSSLTQVLDVATGRVVATLQGGGLFGEDRLTFSPDGTRLAAISAVAFMTFHVRLWDTASGREMIDLGPPPLGGTDLDFSADGHRLRAFGKDGDSAVVKTWDATPRPGASPP